MGRGRKEVVKLKSSRGFECLRKHISKVSSCHPDHNVRNATVRAPLLVDWTRSLVGMDVGPQRQVDLVFLYV